MPASLLFATALFAAPDLTGEWGFLLELELDVVGELRRSAQPGVSDPRPSGSYPIGAGAAVALAHAAPVRKAPDWFAARWTARLSAAQWAAAGAVGSSNALSLFFGVETAFTLGRLRPWLSGEGGINVMIVNAGTVWVNGGFLLGGRAGLDLALASGLRAGVVVGFAHAEGADAPTSNFSWSNIGVRLRWEPDAPD